MHRVSMRYARPLKRSAPEGLSIASIGANGTGPSTRPSPRRKTSAPSIGASISRPDRSPGASINGSSTTRTRTRVAVSAASPSSTRNASQRSPSRATGSSRWKVPGGCSAGGVAPSTKAQVSPVASDMASGTRRDRAVSCRMNDAIEFSDLPLAPALFQGLEALGHVRMTPIQARSLPVLLEGRDVIAQAPTGSGKTAAFGLGLLQRLDLAVIRAQALVLCPTRELADQVAKQIRKLGTGLPNLKLLTLTGGVALGPPLASLAAHAPHVVVGTPGRVQGLLRKQRPG